jgi:uncharacterized protein YciI
MSGHARMGAQDLKLTTYYLVVLMKGNNWSAEDTPERARIQAEHVAHLTKLGDQGSGLAAGPFGDEGYIRGLLIANATSEQQARDLEAADPAVQAGRLTVDVIPFMAPEGWFHKPAMPISMETVYFAFLNGGPARPDQATAERLQSEHMAYMTERNKEGRLILAGPFVRGGSRSGLVVYRAGSAEEAKRLAEGDPKVRAGQLAVEMHEWSIPRGVLR